MAKVYLAGPIAGHSYDGATVWYREAQRNFANYITPVMPMRGKDYLVGEKSISDTYSNVLSTAQGITTRDRMDVMNCDAVLAYLPDDSMISIGVMIEMGWADAYRKPVVLVTPYTSKYGLHGMLQGIVGFRADSLKEGAHIINSLFSYEAKA